MVAQQFVEGQVMGWMALEELAMWAFNATYADDIACKTAMLLCAIALAVSLTISTLCFRLWEACEAAHAGLGLPGARAAVETADD